MEPKRKLLTSTEIKNNADSMSTLIFELLNSSRDIHFLHLKVTGDGSFAAHKALQSYYEDIVDLGDSLAEQYQGLMGKLLSYPKMSGLTPPNSVEDALTYLTKMYDLAAAHQQECPYSEINNGIDEVKTLINFTKYKLTFLE